MEKQLALAQRVVQRMREYGMNPVYPAFAGFVPAALAGLHPEAALTPASNWCRFPAGYCCPYMLDPSDPLFAKIGSTYIRYNELLIVTRCPYKVMQAFLHSMRFPVICCTTPLCSLVGDSPAHSRDMVLAALLVM